MQYFKKLEAAIEHSQPEGQEYTFLEILTEFVDTIKQPCASDILPQDMLVDLNFIFNFDGKLQLKSESDDLRGVSPESAMRANAIRVIRNDLEKREANRA